MPTTIKTGVMKIKDQNGNYIPVDGLMSETAQEELADIQSAGQAQVAAVQAAGQSQVATIQSAGQTQTTAIQNKGTEILNSLPSNYTEVESNVSEIRSAINVVQSAVFDNETVSFPNSGVYYLPADGTSGSSANSIGTGFVEVKGPKLKFKLYEINVLGTICFYTTNSPIGFISSIYGGSTGEYVEDEVDIPATAKYFRACSWNNTESCYLKQITNKMNVIEQKVDAQEEIVNVLSEDVQAFNDKFIYEESVPFPDSGVYYVPSTGASGASSHSIGTGFVEVDGTKLRYKLYEHNSIGTICFYSSNNVSDFISAVSGGSTGAYVKDEVDIPSTAKYFRACSWDNTESCYLKQVSDINLIQIQEDVNTDRTKVDSISNDTDTLLLKESINKPFVFASKVVTAFGDSITQGISSPGLVQTTPYIKYFTDHVGATLVQKAVSGQCIVGTGANTVYTLVTTFTGTTDIIVIAGGTNDFNTSKPIGTYGSSDNTTFYGALKGICEYLNTNYSTASVIFITPIPCTNRTATELNNVNCSLNDYRRAIYEVATTYGFSVVNGADLGMPTEQGGWNDVMCDDADGCHPTVEGHKLYARSLAGKLC